MSRGSAELCSCHMMIFHICSYQWWQLISNPEPQLPFFRSSCAEKKRGVRPAQIEKVPSSFISCIASWSLRKSRFNLKNWTLTGPLVHIIRYPGDTVPFRGLLWASESVRWSEPYRQEFRVPVQVELAIILFFWTIFEPKKLFLELFVFGLWLYDIRHVLWWPVTYAYTIIILPSDLCCFPQETPQVHTFHIVRLAAGPGSEAKHEAWVCGPVDGDQTNLNPNTRRYHPRKASQVGHND